LEDFQKLLSSVVIGRLSLAGALVVGEKAQTKPKEKMKESSEVKIDLDYFPQLLRSTCLFAIAIQN